MSDPIFKKISTHRIRPNPLQPRHFIPQTAIDNMAASLTNIGQQTAAKVRPLTDAERALDPDHDYELIGGHIRHAGALKAEKATLDCLIYDLTLEQAELAALVDNQSTDMYWLDWVIAIEKRYQSLAKPRQQTVADELGFSQARVNNALKIAKALTPASRGQIYQQLIKLGPDDAVTERPMLALVALGDPQLVEKALPVFLDQRLNEPKTQQLVEWVKAGNPIGGFNHQTAPKALKKPKPKPAVAHSPTMPATTPSGMGQPALQLAEASTAAVPAPKLTFWEEVKIELSKEADEEHSPLGNLIYFVLSIGFLWLIITVLAKIVHWIFPNGGS
jgi:ParB family chromosome partitioning protein